MLRQQKLLGLLADGHLHSGNELAEALGVSRTAVWKHVRQLEELSIQVEAQAGQGYQLTEPLELLDASCIREAMTAAMNAKLECFDVLWVTESTSDQLLREGSRPGSGRANVCIAEYQRSGRGRRGRQWFAPPGYGLCLSVGWSFPSSPANLACLGLAVGVAVIRALRASGAEDAQLKWPNDVVVDGKKLAGILIDVQGEAGGPLLVVAGVGVNYAVNEAMDTAVQKAGGLAPGSVSDTLSDHSGAGRVGRNDFAGRLIEAIVGVLQEFEANGFAELASEWRQADCLLGKQVSAQSDGKSIVGFARGISDDGQLLLESAGKIQPLLNGDISIRPVE